MDQFMQEIKIWKEKETCKGKIKVDTLFWEKIRTQPRLSLRRLILGWFTLVLGD